MSPTAASLRCSGPGWCQAPDMSCGQRRVAREQVVRLNPTRPVPGTGQGDERRGRLGNGEDDLAELLARLEALVRFADRLERIDPVDLRLRAPGTHELVRSLEVRARAHRRADDRELLPPHAVQLRGRVRAARRTADGDPAAGRGDCE